MNKTNFESKPIIFYRRGRFHYFKYEGKDYKLNKGNIADLKSKMIYPATIITYAFSRAKVARIINFLARSKKTFKVIRIKTDNPTYVFKVYLF